MPSGPLVDRVVFTPKTDQYEFAGSWTLGKLVSGIVDLPQRMASPTGRALLWKPEINGKAWVAAPDGDFPDPRGTEGTAA